MITNNELIWAAGFLEGEGSFHIGKVSKWQQLVVSASQVQLWPLEVLKKSFGGSIYKEPTKGRRQECGKWVVTGPRAAGVMMTLFALLSPRRQEQIKKALLRWRNPD